MMHRWRPLRTARLRWIVDQTWTSARPRGEGRKLASRSRTSSRRLTGRSGRIVGNGRVDCADAETLNGGEGGTDLTDKDFVLSIALPKDAAGSLLQQQLEGVSVVSFRDDEEQTSRFGLAEAVVVIALAKGVMEVVKLAVEIKERLVHRSRAAATSQRAVISTPDGQVLLVITPEQSNQELESTVKRALAGAT
jgi:hypothetical protein